MKIERAVELRASKLTSFPNRKQGLTAKARYTRFENKQKYESGKKVQNSLDVGGPLGLVRSMIEAR